ncbi:cytochrome bd-type quinol oxidase subunit 2 [Nitrobacteraceae bacterium AZCC 1564]
MTTSKTIAGLIGPTLVAITASMLLNIGSFPTLAEQVSRDPAIIFVSSILLFVAGLAIVRAHNRWKYGWPLLVTVLGWLAVLGGLARMLFPTGLAAIAAGIDRVTGVIIATAIVILGLGALLSFKAYRRD